MPLYDYRCLECSREVEVIHGIHDAGPSTCQHCGGAMRKALSAPAIHFKGSGWAKKDAAAGAKKASSTTEAKPKSESGSTDDAKPSGAETKTTDTSTSESSSSSKSETKSTSTTAGSPSE